MHLYRKRYSASIPADVQRTTATVKGKEVPAVRVPGEDGRPVVHPLNKAGTRMRVPSPFWYGKVAGKDVRLFSNKEASRSELRARIEKHERGLTSLRRVDLAASGLGEHLEAWRSHLDAKESKAKHVAALVGSVRRVFAACGFRTPAEIEIDAVRRHLADLKRERSALPLAADKLHWTRKEVAELLGVGLQAVTAQVGRYRLPAVGNGRARGYPRETVERLLSLKNQGFSHTTIRAYVTALRAFCRWLEDEDRINRNPLRKLRPGKGRVGDRHRRRPLTEAELMRLLASVRKSAAVRRGLTGEDRFWLYTVAVSTGFRARELASLTPDSFDLIQAPIVYLSADHSKNCKGAVQPLPRRLVGELQTYLGSKDRSGTVWPGPWIEKPVEILRPDLIDASIPYVIAGQYCSAHLLLGEETLK